MKLGHFLLMDAFDHLTDKLYRPTKSFILSSMRKVSRASEHSSTTKKGEDNHLPPFETIQMQLDDIVDRLQMVFHHISPRSQINVAHQSFLAFLTWWKKIVFFDQDTGKPPGHQEEAAADLDQLETRTQDDNSENVISSRILFNEETVQFIQDDLRLVEEAFTTRLKPTFDATSTDRYLLSKHVTQQQTKDLHHFFAMFGKKSTKELQAIWQTKKVLSSPSMSSELADTKPLPSTNPFDTMTDERNHSPLSTTALTSSTRSLTPDEEVWLFRLICRRPDAPLDFLLKASKGAGSKLGVLMHRSGDKASSLFAKVLKSSH